jgi:4-aminobutyrate aminotransferase
LIENASDRGLELTAGLRALAAEDSRIGDVRGPGLMIGVEFVEDGQPARPDGLTAQAVQERAAELGLLLLTCGPAHHVIRWIAPLDVTPTEIAESVEIFGEALRTAPRPS